MRKLALVVSLALMLAAPLAHASGFAFPSGKSATQDVTSASPTPFDIPVLISQDGYVYVKLLDTPGSMINSGSPNNGWAAEMSLVRTDGSSVAFGNFTDGSPSIVVPVKSGADLKLHVVVHWPASAQVAGATDIIYGALAFRLTPDGTSPDGVSNGATIDESRSWNVQLHFTTTGTAVPTPTTPTTATPTSATPTPTVTTPTASTSGIGSPTGGTPTDATPDVTAIPTGNTGGSGGASGATTVVVQQSVPTWFLLIIALQGAAIVLLVASHYRIQRRLSEQEQQIRIVARDVPVRENESTSVRSERR